MRILHINCNYVGTSLHQLMIEKLDDMGVENEVFVPVYSKTVATIQPNDNVCLCECFHKWDRLRFNYKQRKIINAIESQYDVKSFDVIHAYTTFTDGNVARVLSEKYGVPYVVAVRNTDVNVFFKWMLHLRSRGRRVLQNAARVFFLSRSYEKLVMERYVFPQEATSLQAKTVVIPNGIADFWLNNKPTEQLSCHTDELKLVYAGVIDRNKNIGATLRAMDCLRKKGVYTHLTVIGKVVDQNAFRAVLSDKHTSYIPFMPKEELIHIYRENDIFVMPSINETFGLVYAEAMSQGLPVIYTRGQGFDDQFAEGTIGYHVDPNDEEEIAKAIERICTEYDGISRRCIEFSRKFNWDTIAARYADIYAQLLKNNSKKTRECNERN